MASVVTGGIRAMFRLIQRPDVPGQCLHIRQTSGRHELISMAADCLWLYKWRERGSTVEEEEEEEEERTGGHQSG